MTPHHARYAVAMSNAALTAIEKRRTLLRTGCLREPEGDSAGDGRDGEEQGEEIEAD